MTTTHTAILYQSPTVLVVQTQAGQFDKFDPKDLYGQFNLGLHVGDEPACVLTNRAKLLLALRDVCPDVQAIHWLDQIHSDRVVDIDCTPIALKARCADALISSQSGQALAIMTADCVPVAIFAQNDSNDVNDRQDCQDFQDMPIACIHAGWQGLTNGIIAKTVKQMQSTHSKAMTKTAPKIQYHAVIGTHIRQASYEIGKDLAQKIITLVCQDNLVALSFDELYQRIIKETSDDKCLIDLYALAKLELEHLGVSVLGDEPLCSYQDERFYSYRAQTHAKKSATGRMATVIVKL